MAINRFTIQIDDSVLDDLKYRLDNVRWPEEKEDEAWRRGTDLGYLKALVSYWQNGYDWRTQEQALNRYHHYTCEIDGMPVHFIHERAKTGGALAAERPVILFTHGWPDSFLRYTKIIPLLTDPGSFGGDPDAAFNVVIPSIPGFGFSGASGTTTYHNARVADLWHKLMTAKLGYKKFGAAGGDIGSGVTRYLALQHPGSLTGIHLTDFGIIRALLTASDTTLQPEELDYKKAAQQWIVEEGGYMSIQSTKPQTLAYGLSDSPVGLAAWIIEKFRSWSDCKGDVEARFSKDELLTNIMIYWINNNIGSTAHRYYDNMHGLPPMQPIAVPTGMALFPADLLPPPRRWAEQNLNIVRWTQMTAGGHFGAMEEPVQYADDVRAFFLSI